MERVATLAWPLLGLTLLVFLQLAGTQATGRRLTGYPDPLPSCSKVPGGIPGWECYDPPNHPLPPCDFHHQRIGFDCSGWPPVSHVDVASPSTFKSKTRPLLERHIAIDLPPCSQASDDTNSWKCPDARTWPPTVGSDAGDASPATVTESEKTQEKGGHVEAVLTPLRPCTEVLKPIPGWNCFGNPYHPLPPCDAHHHRIGKDCSGWPPAGSDAGEASPATVTESEKMQEKGGHVEAVLTPLRPCTEVLKPIPGWNCFGNPYHPLPPCNAHHHHIGKDCSGWPPAAAH